MPLVPKTVTVSSSFKAFGFRDGLSSGSDLSMTFDVEGDMSIDEVRKEIYKAKYSLDMMALRIEAGKGMIPQELVNEISTRARKTATEMVNGSKPTTSE